MTTTDPKPLADPAAKPSEKPDDAALGKNVLDFIDGGLAITSRKKKEVKPKPETSSDSEDLGESNTPAPAPEPKKKVAAKAATPPPPLPQIDEERLGEAVGRSVAKAMEKRAPAEPPEPDLPAELKPELAIYQRLEKHFPEKYKGFAKQFVANAAKFARHTEKWKADHPGATFNADDPEHNELRESLETATQYDEDDATTALVRDSVAEERTKLREDFDKDIGPLKERLRLADAEKEITEAQGESRGKFWEAIADEFPGVIDDKGGFSETAWREAQEKDPQSANMVVRAAEDASSYARELHLLDNNLTPYLGGEIITENTPPARRAQILAHRFLQLRGQREEEAELARARAHKDGRRFATRAEAEAMSPAERAKVWTISTKGMRNLLARHIAEEVRAVMHKGAKKEGQNGDNGNDDSLSHPTRRPDLQPRFDQSERDEKPLSPTTQIAPRLASSREKTASSHLSPLDAFVMGGPRRR